MRKMMKKTVCVALIALLALMMVACGASDEMTGTSWKLTGGEAMGVEMAEADIESIVGSMSMEFQKGGIVVVDLNGEEGKASYTLKDNLVTIVDLTGTMEATVEGDKMSLVQEQGGVEVTLIFTKQ